MITDHQLADELIKLATLLRMGLKPEVPPQIRYLLHACHAEIEKPRFDGGPSAKCCEQSYTQPAAILLDFRPSDNFRNLRRQNSHTFFENPRHIDPEYDFTLRIIDLNRDAAHLCPGHDPYKPDHDLYKSSGIKKHFFY